MKEQIETPRMDKAEAWADETWDKTGVFPILGILEEGRQLERELSSANAALEETIKSSDAVCDSYAKENQRLHDRAIAAEASLTQERADAERMREALRGVIADCGYQYLMGITKAKIDAAIDQARSAK